MNFDIILGFIGGLFIGTPIGIFLICLLQSASRADNLGNQSSGNQLSDQRKLELVDRMLDIFDECDLSCDEVASILRKGNITNAKIDAASDRIAGLLQSEQLSIEAAKDLFNDCYDALFAD